jgi:hypothetical protein
MELAPLLQYQATFLLDERSLPLPQQEGIVMSQPNLQSQPPREDALALSLDHLHQALAADSAGCGRNWAQAVGDALANLEAALRQHRKAARRPDGPLAEVDQTRPTLARQADEVCSDYDELLRQLLALREQVQEAAEASRASSSPTTAGGLVEISAVRERAEQILAGLQKNRQDETNLVLESVNTDIGAGD